MLPDIPNDLYKQLNGRMITISKPNSAQTGLLRRWEGMTAILSPYFFRNDAVRDFGKRDDELPVDFDMNSQIYPQREEVIEDLVAQTEKFYEAVGYAYEGNLVFIVNSGTNHMGRLQYIDQSYALLQPHVEISKFSGVRVQHTPRCVRFSGAADITPLSNLEFVKNYQELQRRHNS